MNAMNVTKARGIIIKVPDGTPGILVAGGQQRYFTLDGVWKSPVAPAANQTVDVELDGAGALAAVVVVDQQQLNKERLAQFSGVAQEHGKEAARLAQQGIGALAARMGKVAFGAAVLLWIAWFFFPAAGLSGGMLPPQSYTFWGLLGTDFNSIFATIGAGIGSGSDHGLFATIGLIAILAPFAAPFIRAAWSRYLNAAPLAYVLMALVAIYVNESKVFGDVAKAVGASPFSFSWGILVLLVATPVLALGAFRKPA